MKCFYFRHFNLEAMNPKVIVQLLKFETFPTTQFDSSNRFLLLKKLKN